MQFIIRPTHDTLTPDIKKKLLALAPQNRTHVLRGMAEGLVWMTKRAFYEPQLRPIPWANKADGTPATLRLNQHLRRSPRVIMANSKEALVGSDRKYAAIHQLGGKTSPHIIKPKFKKALFWPGAGHPVKEVKHPGSKIPARPFFPFHSSGRPTAAARKRLEQLARTRLKALGL